MKTKSRGEKNKEREEEKEAKEEGGWRKNGNESGKEEEVKTK